MSSLVKFDASIFKCRVYFPGLTMMTTLERKPSLFSKQPASIPRFFLLMKPVPSTDMPQLLTVGGGGGRIFLTVLETISVFGSVRLSFIVRFVK